MKVVFNFVSGPESEPSVDNPWLRLGGRSELRIPVAFLTVFVHK